MTVSKINIDELLGARGPLANSLPGFASRQSQQQMASAVGDALVRQEKLLVEAGTGTGKTFAYLLPALLSKKKVIIATGTKNLQDQLFQRDLPTLRKALALPSDVALLKGRANYLCVQRLDEHLSDLRFLTSDQILDLRIVQQWSLATKTGDIAEVDEIPEDSPVWPLATSTADNCFGHECPLIKKCYVAKARKLAQAADIIVINHHLFFADVVLRDTGFGELLPTAEAVIFDEAHQVPEIASQFFGHSISSRQLIELARDVQKEYQRKKDHQALQTVANELEQAARQFRLAFGQGIQKTTWSRALENKIESARTDVIDALTELKMILKPVAQKSKVLENCLERTQELQHSFELLTSKAPDDQIHWFETFTKTVRIHHTPISIADTFRKITDTEQAWIFTSATLAVSEDFSTYQKELGLENAKTLSLESPFDYQQQALMYLPQNMLQPQNDNYIHAVVDAALPVLKASRGRAFMLFTSHRALQLASQLLAGRINYPLLVQGDMSKTVLLQEFASLKNPILLGTNSFWEGVDVRGEQLSCVIIDKLPFASPGDPVFQARLTAMRKQGIEPFHEYQLPRAVIALKQGVGRLIRDVTDRGVLMICDPRLFEKSYGKIFLQSLPPFKQTQSLQATEQFINLELKKL